MSKSGRGWAGWRLAVFARWGKLGFVLAKLDFGPSPYVGWDYRVFWAEKQGILMRGNRTDRTNKTDILRSRGMGGRERRRGNF